MKDRVVLAYSGGLDTSVAVNWIQEKYNVDVVTMTLDLGQKIDLKAAEEKAKSIGAVKHYSIDAKDEFAENYVAPAIKANALYEGKYPIGTALSRPLIASKLVEVAKKEGAVGVAHGSTGKGNDQVRFDVTMKSLAPELKIIAPIREWNLSREEEIRFAEERGIPIPVGLESPYSVDQNLWGRSIECGPLEQPDLEPPEEVFEWTKKPEDAPEKAEYVSVRFDRGVPVAFGGEKKSLAELIEELNSVAGAHGVGRVDHIEDRLVGFKSREVYESPAATVIIEAHKDLEKIALTRHELFFKRQIEDEWTSLVYNGLWVEPLREDLEAFINKSQEHVAGEVKLKLYKGGFRVVGRSSPFSLYDKDLSTYDVATTFDQRWSQGFIELWGLPTMVANTLRRKRGKKA